MSLSVSTDAERAPLPYWTAAGPPPRRLRAFYPLGIDSATQTLERALFDGITSQTPHVRYYAFYAWALTRFRHAAQREGPTLAPTEFRRRERRWVARLEAVLRAATMLENPDVGGMFGRNAATERGSPPPTGRWQLPDAAPYPTTGLNFHIGPLVALNCGTHREGHRGEFRAGSGAQCLADAMDACCAARPGGRAALSRLLRSAGSGARSMEATDIQLLAPALALGPVPPRSPLYEPLVSLLFGAIGGTAPAKGTTAWSRRQALTLCLDIARQASGRVTGTPIEILRCVILTGHFPKGHEYALLPGHERTYFALRRLYERHLLQLALYGLWRDVTYSLASAPGQALSLVRLTAMLESAIADGGAARTTQRWLGSSPLEATVADLVQQCATERRRLRPTPWRSGEIRLARAVVKNPSDRTHRVAAPAFALLMAVAQRWLYAKRNGRHPRCADAHAIGGRERLSLDVVSADLVARGDLSGAAYFAWVIEAYVIGQSLRATIAKGPQTSSGEYVYFIVPDAGGYRINHPSRLRSYLQIDSPRLRFALGMLVELGLIAEEPHLTATRHGLRWLKELTAT